MSKNPLSPPPDLNDNGKKVWNTSIAIFSDLFPELLEKDFLKRRYELPQNFVNIIENIDKLLIAFSEINYIFSERGKSKEFLKYNEKYGFTEKGLAYLWASNIIFNLLNNAEMIRNTFLEVLKINDLFYPRMGLGQLLINLEKETTKGKDLNILLDSTLRNALAHRTYVINFPNLMYFKDMNLNKAKTIHLSKLVEKVYEYNIISKSLIEYVTHMGDVLFT